MNAPRSIGKLTAIVTVATILTFFVALPASALDTVFEIRARNGPVGLDEPGSTLVRLMDPQNSVRVGVELRPGMLIGFDSKYGVGIIVEF